MLVQVPHHVPLADDADDLVLVALGDHDGADPVLDQYRQQAGDIGVGDYRHHLPALAADHVVDAHTRTVSPSPGLG